MRARTHAETRARTPGNRGTRAASHTDATHTHKHTRAADTRLLLLALLDRVQLPLLLLDVFDRGGRGRLDIHGPLRLQEAHGILLHGAEARRQAREQVLVCACACVCVCCVDVGRWVGACWWRGCALPGV
jgi:hypothetical protein